VKREIFLHFLLKKNQANNLPPIGLPLGLAFESLPFTRVNPATKF